MGAEVGTQGQGGAHACYLAKRAAHDNRDGTGHVAEGARRTLIYAIRAADGTGPVKIGYTNGPVRERLKALQSGSPVVLACIALTDGSMADEQSLHRSSGVIVWQA